MLSGDHSEGRTARLSLVFVNASYFSSTFRHSCLPDRAALVLSLASSLLHFDQMSNAAGDVIVCRSLEIIENRPGKRSMYLMYLITIVHNSKLWLFVRVKWGC